MNKQINYVFIALGLAIVIPIGISVYLIKTTFELEQKKFDSEVVRYSSEVFYAFKADYYLVDSITDKQFFEKENTNKENTYTKFEKLLKKAYKCYEFIGDSLRLKFIENGYDIDFNYLLEIAELRLTNNQKERLYIDEIKGEHPSLALFGKMPDKQKKVYYSFFFKGGNYTSLLKLYLDYPDKKQFLLKKTLPSIIGVLVSMLVLIAILVYTVKVLFWQKRESDMKSHFIDNITHEFNTPVSTLKVSAASIKQLNKEFNSEVLKSIGERIHNQSTRLAALIEKVMNISANNKATYCYQMETVHLNSETNSILSQFCSNNKADNVEFTINLLAKDDIVAIDTYYFKVAIVNLLENALKYSKEYATIEVSTNNSKNTVCLIIKDNGIGISKSAQKYIFKRFYRGGNMQHYKSQGLGLGLSIVKQIIKAHHGKITVKSKTGKGTLFKIVLPLKHD